MKNSGINLIVEPFDHPLQLYYIEPISNSSISGYLTIKLGQSL